MQTIKYCAFLYLNICYTSLRMRKRGIYAVVCLCGKGCIPYLTRELDITTSPIYNYDNYE